MTPDMDTYWLGFPLAHLGPVPEYPPLTEREKGATLQEETQATIEEWRLATFGPGGSNARMAARLNEEMAELLAKLTTDDNHPGAAEEIADVVIVLYGLASRLGVDLEAALLGAAGKDRPPGPLSNAEYAAGANGGVADLVHALTRSEVSTAAEEQVRFLARHMVRLSNHMGFLLPAEIDRKMAINRKRQWQMDGSGHGYHVRAGASPEIGEAVWGSMP